MIQNMSSVEKNKPYANLLLRLKDALTTISNKTNAFQVDCLMEKGESENVRQTESEFEIELRIQVELAEHINNRLPF